MGGSGSGGRGGTLFLCQTAAKRAKIIYFSKLQPRLILGTGLVGPQLLNKDLDPPLLLPVFPILQRMYC